MSFEAPLILIVDNDPDCRFVFGLTLQGVGFRIVEAGDGHEAIQVCANEVPAVIVLDCAMPITNGTELAAALAQDPRWKGIPIICASAREVSRVPRSNIVGWLKKPVSLEHLLSLVREVTSRATN